MARANEIRIRQKRPRQSLAEEQVSVFGGSKAFGYGMSDDDTIVAYLKALIRLG